MSTATLAQIEGRILNARMDDTERAMRRKADWLIRKAEMIEANFGAAHEHRVAEALAEAAGLEAEAFARCAARLGWSS